MSCARPSGARRRVITAMEKAEKRVDPVLQPLRDRVLFLKHNLNASAIGALDKELVALRTNVDALVVDLESSIAEAETFIAQMDAEATTSMRTLMRTLLIATVCAALAGVTYAQAPAPPPPTDRTKATHFSAADLQAALAKLPTDRPSSAARRLLARARTTSTSSDACRSRRARRCTKHRPRCST